MIDASAQERLIVALDVPSVAEAVVLVDELDSVSFFKVGWELFLAGVLKGNLKALLDRLSSRQIFLDLKVPGDIDNTVAAIVRLCMGFENISLLTLSESMRPKTIGAAASARMGRGKPKLLTVPLLSSLDASDLPQTGGPSVPADDFILNRARAALQAGCDGVIASGSAIRLCRQNLPPDTLIVSPGIRPAGSSTDDHKRSTTPSQAIGDGADYVVVGRPITKAARPAESARQIVEEVDAALGRRATEQTASR